MILILNPYKDPTRKINNGPISLINTDEKSSMYSNWSQQYIKITHHDQMKFICVARMVQHMKITKCNITYNRRKV